jgi:hypothetical protein
MMLRRRPTEVDWQSELRARTAVTEPAAEAVTARRAGNWKRIRRIIGLAMVVAVLALQFSDYAAKHSRDSLEWLVGGFLLLSVAPLLVGGTLKALWQKWNPPLTVFEEEGDVRGRIRYELGQAGLELRQMLAEPTERAVYERWLGTETEQLELIAPNTARRWAQPDPGHSSPGGMVSEAELDSRRRRLIDLYSAVSSPQQTTEFERLLQAPSARAITNS